jgi:outer membrane protein
VRKKFAANPNWQTRRRNDVNFRILGPARMSSAIKLLSLGAIAATCLLGAAARAQSPAPAGSASVGKIGVLGVRQAIASTAEGKQAGAELQSQFASRQNELEALNKQINELRQRLDAGGAKLSQEEQARLQREGTRLTQQLDRKQNEYQEDVNAAQAEVFDRIGRKMMDVLDRYARDNGYVAVLDTSAQNTPIIFASTNIDVTQDIVRLYDQAYPVKAGSSTTAPATPRPTSTTPRPTAAPAQKPPQR